jgi:hypothetical protein
MKGVFPVLLVVCCVNPTPMYAQQVWAGTLSESMCGASHQSMASAGGLMERQCILACINALSKYVLVDANKQIIPIANQDVAGFPLYAGRPVRLTGVLKGDAIIVSKIEAIPAHLHLGHVMTNWRDTPSNVGFLIAAVSDANVAAVHAKLAAKTPDNLDEMKLHAGHVLNALDPVVEPKGPASGYGVKKAATGALQHLQFAVQGEGATVNIKTHATHVSASLNDVLQWTDQAIATARQIRSSTVAADAARLVTELVALTTEITDGNDANKDGQIGWQTGEGGLRQAQMHMGLMMKGEGLQNAPR